MTGPTNGFWQSSFAKTVKRRDSEEAEKPLSDCKLYNINCCFFYENVYSVNQEERDHFHLLFKLLCVLP